MFWFWFYDVKILSALILSRLLQFLLALQWKIIVKNVNECLRHRGHSKIASLGQVCIAKTWKMSSELCMLHSSKNFEASKLFILACYDLIGAMSANRHCSNVLWQWLNTGYLVAVGSSNFSLLLVSVLLSCCTTLLLSCYQIFKCIQEMLGAHCIKHTLLH